jgi:hypothetical protein
MSIVDELNSILESGKKIPGDNLDPVELQKFTKELRDHGLIKKQSYSIPPVDTIGRKFYETFRSHTDNK